MLGRDCSTVRESGGCHAETGDGAQLDAPAGERAGWASSDQTDTFSEDGGRLARSVGGLTSIDNRGGYADYADRHKKGRRPGSNGSVRLIPAGERPEASRRQRRRETVCYANGPDAGGPGTRGAVVALVLGDRGANRHGFRAQRPGCGKMIRMSRQGGLEYGRESTAGVLTERLCEPLLLYQMPEAHPCFLVP